MSTLKAYWLKKVGTHRGSPRVWLDMPRLAEAGLAPGARFDLDVVPHGIRIRRSDSGSRCVSAKTLKSGAQLPVIDLNSRTCLSPFAGHGFVRVIVREDAVYVLLLASELAKLERTTRLRTKLANGQPLAVASLSHGVGVLSLAAHHGLSDSGLRCELVAFNEIHDGYATQSALANPASTSATPLCAPMQELIQDSWALDKLPKVEVMELGLPCSGASIAGKSKLGLAKMEDHPHVGHLAHAALVLIARLQPAALVLENVEEYAKTASAQMLRHQLSDMGYRVEEFVLKAHDFGALENRVRWALVAITEGVPSLGFIEPSKAAAELTAVLGDLLEPVAPDSPAWSPMGYLRDKEVRDRAAGKGFAMQVVTPASTSVPTIRKQYNKGGSTDPYVQHPDRPELLRKFTPAEHARIKGVPEELVAGMSVTAAHEALGQGIVVAPFRSLFKRLGHCLKRTGTPSSTLQPGWARGDGGATG
jgi:DNA (cytosine-5)-methyltransferase 1